MVDYSKAIGGNTDFLSSQAFTFPKIIPYDQTDHVFLAVIISGAGDDCFTRIRQSSPFIEEHFFSSEKSVPNRLTELLPKLKDHLQGVQNLQVLLVSWKDNVLYLLSSGTHQAYIQRKEKKLNLTEHSPFEEIVSGHLKMEDKILLISGRTDMQQVNWNDEQINHLLTSSTEDLEADTNILLSQSGQPEPIATILVENKNPDQKTTVVTKTEEIPTNKFFMPRPILKMPSLKPLVRHLKPRSKRSAIFITILIFILIGVGFGGYRYFQNKTKEEAIIAEGINYSRSKFAEAQSLKDSDPERAQQSLSDAKITISGVISRSPGNQEAEKLKQEIENGRQFIMRIYPVTDWPVFLSLDLIKSDFQPKQLSYSVSKVLMMDEKQKTLVEIDLKKKTNNILAGSTQLGGARVSSLNGDNAFVYSEDKGVLAIDTQNQKLTVVAKPDPEWGYIKDIVGFAGNVYLLDSVKNQIWKYVPTQSGYSERQTYLPSGAQVNFGGSLQMKIDYSVWILKEGPEIFRFTGGNFDNFSVGGLDENLKEIKTLFADEDGDELYLLDSENSRVVVLTKDGKYLKQYTGDKFATADDLVVDNESKKMYLLEGNKLYQLDLK
jgi:hypothetical protein